MSKASTDLPVRKTEMESSLVRKRNNGILETLFAIGVGFSLLVGLGALLCLIIDVTIDGAARLDWQFLSSFPSRKPQEAGILAALVGSVCLIILTGIIAVPIGVGAAIYLEEYAPNNRLTRLLEVNIANLAGTPSIIYGLLGLEVFVRFMKLERSLIAGALTMSLLILPIIIISARESIRRVPGSIKQGALALGATEWQVIRDHLLPISFPGILTGVILAISRAIGETAPLITIGALTYVAFLPDGLHSPFTALPIQIFNWVSRPQQGFHENAAAGILVLLFVTLMFNAMALYLRDYFQRKKIIKAM